MGEFSEEKNPDKYLSKKKNWEMMQDITNNYL